MRSAIRRVSKDEFVGRSSRKTGLFSGQVIQAMLTAVIAAGVFWLVWIYGNGLRDPRYLDGWILVGGMAVQVFFHIAQRTVRMSPKIVKRWRRFHIFMGLLLFAIFLMHTDFSLPDTGLEWGLWLGFVLIALSGVFGIYLSWSIETKRRIDENIGYDRIPTRRAELARTVRAAVTGAQSAGGTGALPSLPYDGWIQELYAKHLRDFFKGQQNYTAHLLGSQQSLTRLTDEIDALSQYVDQRNQERLSVIKDMVLEKDRLDYARVYLGLTRAWLVVHGPVAYALVVLVVLHVLVVYAFSSGAW